MVSRIITLAVHLLLCAVGGWLAYLGFKADYPGNIVLWLVATGFIVPSLVTLRFGFPLVVLLVVFGFGKPCRAEPLPQTFYLYGPVTAYTEPYVMEWLRVTASPVMIISSPGGDKAASERIADAVKAKGNVRCVVHRMAASGAFGILQSCAVREIEAGAFLVTHEPSGVPMEPMDRVAAAQFLREIEGSAQKWNDRCRARMKLTAADYESRVKGRDFEMNSSEALLYGAVDKIDL